MSTPTAGKPATKKRANKTQRSRSCNPRATTVNVPCLPHEKKRWTAAAAAEAGVLGISKLSLAEHARRLLNQHAAKCE